MAEAVRRVHTHTVIYFRGRTEKVKNGMRCIIKTRWTHVSSVTTYFMVWVLLSPEMCVKCSDCTVSNGRMINDNVLGRIWKWRGRRQVGIVGLCAETSNRKMLVRNSGATLLTITVSAVGNRRWTVGDTITPNYTNFERFDIFYIGLISWILFAIYS
jgi:hypothetical protein